MYVLCKGELGEVHTFFKLQLKGAFEAANSWKSIIIITKHFLCLPPFMDLQKVVNFMFIFYSKWANFQIFLYTELILFSWFIDQYFSGLYLLCKCHQAILISHSLVSLGALDHFWYYKKVHHNVHT